MSNNPYVFKMFIDNAFIGILNQIESDLKVGVSQNDYIKHENAEKISDALKSLDSVHVKYFNLDGLIKQLDWFVDVDAQKVKDLQLSLNNLRNYNLLEDGVYGAKTSEAINSFSSMLLSTISSLQAFCDLSEDLLPKGISKIEILKIDFGRLSAVATKINYVLYACELIVAIHKDCSGDTKGIDTETIKTFISVAGDFTGSILIGKVTQFAYAKIGFGLGGVAGTSISGPLGGAVGSMVGGVAMGTIGEIHGSYRGSQIGRLAGDAISDAYADEIAKK